MNQPLTAASTERAQEAGGGQRGQEGPGSAQAVIFRRWGSDRTGYQSHYKDMESSAGEAGSAKARRPARPRSDIPPPPSTALGCSAIPPPPVTALASCSPIPPPPSIAHLAPAE